jgi:hypothetical protein
MVPYTGTLQMAKSIILSPGLTPMGGNGIVIRDGMGCAVALLESKCDGYSMTLVLEVEIQILQYV